MTSRSLIICGADDVPDALAAVPGAALISIRRYGAEPKAWARGRPDTLCLSFDDIDEDKPLHGYVAPTRVDVETALDFAARRQHLPLIVHCAAGVSRSPATMLAILASRRTHGGERIACDEVIAVHNATVDAGLRPAGFGVSPLGRIVRFADDILGRHGALVEAWKAAPWATTKQHGHVERTAGGLILPVKRPADSEMAPTNTPAKPSTVRPGWRLPGLVCRHGRRFEPYAEWTGDYWAMWLAPTCLAVGDRCPTENLDGNSAWPFVEPVASAVDMMKAGFRVIG
jgi:predicted protein tyrosine phosphatase